MGVWGGESKPPVWRGFAGFLIGCLFCIAGLAPALLCHIIKLGSSTDKKTFRGKDLRLPNELPKGIQYGIRSSLPFLSAVDLSLGLHGILFTHPASRLWRAARPVFPGCVSVARRWACCFRAAFFLSTLQAILFPLPSRFLFCQPSQPFFCTPSLPCSDPWVAPSSEFARPFSSEPTSAIIGAPRLTRVKFMRWKASPWAVAWTGRPASVLLR